MRASLRQYPTLLIASLFNTRNSQAPIGVQRLAAIVFFVLPLVALQVFHRVCLLLDNVLYPGWRRAAITAPVFVVGIPRSGTTYLHRVLAADQDRFTTMRLWEMVFAPAVVQRKALLALIACDRALGRPVARTFDCLQRLVLGRWGGIHKIAFDEPEEDYLLLLPICACFLLYLPFPFPRRLGWLAFFDRDATTTEKRRVMNFYRACLKRHLYVTGDQHTLLSKNVSFTPMLESLIETFPDARIIGCHRTPHETVPSQLSSMASGGAAFGSRADHPEFTAFFLDLLEYYYDHLYQSLSELPENRRRFVAMSRLTADVGGTIRNLYQRFDFSLSDGFAEYLDTETEKTRNYRSKHRYRATDFGLDDERIHERFAGAIALFDYPTHQSTSPAT